MNRNFKQRGKAVSKETPPEIYAGLIWERIPPELRSVLPKSKGDIERASATVRLGYPTVAPILPHLMRWLQDRNWPVAEIIAPFLANIGAPLLPEIRTVLRSNDDIWIMWVLNELVKPRPDIFVNDLRDELLALTHKRSEEEINVLAMEILTARQP